MNILIKYMLFWPFCPYILVKKVILAQNKRIVIQVYTYLDVTFRLRVKTTFDRFEVVTLVFSWKSVWKSSNFYAYETQLMPSDSGFKGEEDK